MQFWHHMKYAFDQGKANSEMHTNSNQLSIIFQFSCLANKSNKNYFKIQKNWPFFSISTKCLNHKIDFLQENIFHRKNCNWISNLFSMPIYKMQLRHATPKNLLQKFSKSISFLMNGNSLQNLLRSIDIAQSFCLRKQKVEKWFYFITVCSSDADLSRVK